jgi:tRNA pseudouridine55 synthase
LPRSGVLLLDKPQGLSSNAALQRVRGVFQRLKGGHTGTLDPMATGLLPVCLGEATKFASGLLEADKTYEATMKLGVSTTTGDAEGEPVVERDVGRAGEQLASALQAFVGEIDQVPPMYSALKHRGRPLYEYARQGQDIERAPRRVRIYEIECLSRGSDEVRVRVRCSKGTYIRSLAHDLGERLGCGAHLTALRRTVIGPLTIERAVTLEQLREAPPESIAAWLLPADMLVSHLPALMLPASSAYAILRGQVVQCPLDFTGTGEARLYDPGQGFLGIGVVTGERLVRARRMSSEQPPAGSSTSLERIPVSG